LLVVAAEFLGTIEYHMVNLPLFLGGVVASSFITFNSTQYLTLNLGKVRWADVWDVTNRQTLVLLLVMTTIIFATKDKDISRLFIGYFVLLSWVILLFLNSKLPVFLSRLVFRGENIRACLLVGSPEMCARVEKWLHESQHLGFNIIGLITFDGKDKGISTIPLHTPILGGLLDLPRVMRERNVSQIVLLGTHDSQEEVHEIMQICEKEGCRVLIYNPWEQYFKRPLHVIQEGPHTFFALKEDPLGNPVNQFTKRMLDLAISLPVVLFVLPILCLFVSLIHLFFSRGPLFFKQERCGINGKTFWIYKFRTMRYQDPSKASEGTQASANDSRIFPLGTFLRRSSLDEFPQFINVLIGDMSVVGPRPHFREHDDIFAQYVDVYRQRQFAKPGITGLAQTRGYRGEIKRLDMLHKRVHYDLEYVDNWSFSMDIGLIIRTAWQVFFPPKSAY
tara:strand:+ start:17927 stop:19270 length:1344 start_codon:yes stop_codon:yes gene_type:complete